MERLSRYGRRMRITLIKTMTVACFVCIIAIPFLSKKLLKTEANYYSITINGIKVGAANTEEEVIVALASARQDSIFPGLSFHRSRDGKRYSAARCAGMPGRDISGCSETPLTPAPWKNKDMCRQSQSF